MGGSFSDLNMCCKNHYVIKNSETDLEIFKKDINKSKTGRKEKIIVYDEDQDFAKNKRNKEFLDKHMKDSSFKNNLSTARIDQQERINKLATIIQSDTSPVLTLKVLNSSSNMVKGTIISINCQGLLEASDISNSANRNEKDGFAYFGYYADTSIKDLDTIDYNIPISKSTTEKNEQANIGRHFQIEFKLEKLSFYIRDLGVGYGTFVRLDYPLIIKDNHLINIGESFLVANIIEKNEDLSHVSQQQAGGSSIMSNKNIQLKMKVYGVNNNGETFYFPPMNKNITIGRYYLADIHINDKLLSKIHCVINYSEKDGWTLLDGHDDKPSTNGTWLYLNEDFEIYDKMIFKTNQSILQCFVNNEDQK